MTVWPGVGGRQLDSSAWPTARREVRPSRPAACGPGARTTRGTGCG